MMGVVGIAVVMMLRSSRGSSIAGPDSIRIAVRVLYDRTQRLQSDRGRGTGQERAARRTTDDLWSCSTRSPVRRVHRVQQRLVHSHSHPLTLTAEE